MGDEHCRSLNPSIFVQGVWEKVCISRFVWPYFPTFLSKYNIDVFPSVMKSSRFDGLIKYKDYENYMCYPTNFVTKVTTICEKTLKPDLEKKEWLGKQFFFDKINMKILNVFIREQN